MKNHVNRNFLWAQIFVEQLSKSGVKYASISPGSRSTPLTLAFSENSKIKTFVNIDERTSGFFALGLANKTNSPVAVVTTSGTATANLYPAIIEAFQQRIPLIVCTADRPPEMQNCGANQTINQQNIYANHIRYFANIGLPSLSMNKINRLKKITHTAVQNSLIFKRGPIHLNFPFRKPFEPKTFTDSISKDFITKSKVFIYSKAGISKTDLLSKNKIAEFTGAVKKYRKGIIICGGYNYSNKFPEICTSFASKLGYPIFAEGNSGLRFSNSSKKLVLSNSTAFLKSDALKKIIRAEIIIQFGNTPISNIVQNFIKKSKADKYLINSFGDYQDPSRTAQNVFAITPEDFCRSFLDSTKNLNFTRSKEWINKLLTYEKISEDIKREKIENAKFPFEGRIVTETFKLIPNNTNFMFSNSMPVRDLDFFASFNKKYINIFSNRGASGIDGIISTAAGVAVESVNPTVLIIGDLAFYHDMNSLLILRKQKIPLVIILIDNNGGGIFNMLPISSYRKSFTNYFRAPLDIDLLSFAKSYGGNSYEIENWEDLNTHFLSALKRKRFTVLRIKTNAKNSLKIREAYWQKVDKEIKTYNDNPK
ncbi:2-succinyl-5-enolpyruvyl-6-hydroxy-3-cyclohexene-1-carboxylate synthase [bacterium BMS3Abin04]|nr:2-succinyl-5-enolpyruvyl-6-hydroxy-3-cyclohexene-1-carboxylate synthase [bacterium BMS3Abin04]